MVTVKLLLYVSFYTWFFCTIPCFSYYGTELYAISFMSSLSIKKMLFHLMFYEFLSKKILFSHTLQICLHNFFWTQKIFGHKIVFGHKIFWGHKFFLGSIIFFVQTFSWTLNFLTFNFFRCKFFLDVKFFSEAKIFGP